MADKSVILKLLNKYVVLLLVIYMVQFILYIPEGLALSFYHDFLREFPLLSMIFNGGYLTILINLAVAIFLLNDLRNLDKKATWILILAIVSKEMAVIIFLIFILINTKNEIVSTQNV